MKKLLRKDVLSVGIVAVGAVSFLSPAWSAPITFNTALPVAKGELIFREQLVFNKSSDDPGTADRDRESKSAVSVLGYGATRDITLFGILPYLENSLELTKNSARRVRSARGVGDVSLFGRYSAFTRNWPQRTLRIAPFAGLKMPTGNDTESDSFGRLPASVQLGSGSWDPFGGIVLTYQTLDYQIDTQFSYKANTKANGFEFGDIARFDSSFQYRLWPQKLSGGTPGFLYGVAEVNLINKDKNRDGGTDDQNSGGTYLFLSPGIQYVTRRWVAEASVQVPLVQNLNGTALGNDYIAHAGLRVNF